MMRTWEDIRENQTSIPKNELSLIEALSFLQAQRIKQGISQTEFAKRINISQQQLANIENLDSMPTRTMLSKYAKGLGIELASKEIANLIRSRETDNEGDFDKVWNEL